MCQPVKNTSKEEAFPLACSFILTYCKDYCIQLQGSSYGSFLPTKLCLHSLGSHDLMVPALITGDSSCLDQRLLVSGGAGFAPEDLQLCHGRSWEMINQEGKKRLKINFSESTRSLKQAKDGFIKFRNNIDCSHMDCLE